MAYVPCPVCGKGRMDEISALKADLKAALDNADHWMSRKEECARELTELREEDSASAKLVSRLSGLLTGVVIALKGTPPPLTHWDQSDVVTITKQIVAENARLRQDERIRLANVEIAKQAGNSLVLEAVDPLSICDLNPETSLLYRFTGKSVYMQNPARIIHIHKFSEALAECYRLPEVEK